MTAAQSKDVKVDVINALQEAFRTRIRTESWDSEGEKIDYESRAKVYVLVATDPEIFWMIEVHADGCSDASLMDHRSIAVSYPNLTKEQIQELRNETDKGAPERIAEFRTKAFAWFSTGAQNTPTCKFPLNAIVWRRGESPKLENFEA